MNCLNVCWSLEAIALILSGTHVDTHITPHMQQHTIRGDSCLSVQILRFNLGQNVPKKKKRFNIFGRHVKLCFGRIGHYISWQYFTPFCQNHIFFGITKFIHRILSYKFPQNI